MIKKLIISIAEKILWILRNHRIPSGLALILKHYPEKPLVIFDVGANTGQSSVEFSRWLKIAQVYAFEPSPSSFKKLASNVKSFRGISIQNIALGAKSGMLTLSNDFESSMNKVVSKQSSNTIDVEVSTVDKFIGENAISHIDFLKIDVEGFELEVLLGAKEILLRQGVTFIEIEAGLAPTNNHHQPLNLLKEFLEAHGYFLILINEQVHEWIENKKYLRRCNALFIHKDA